MIPRGRTWVLIVIAATASVGVVLYAWLKHNISATPTSAPTTSAVSPGSVAFAPVGQLIAGFPKDLILDGNVTVGGSYSIHYSSSTNQYTAEWNSSSSLDALYASYKQYLSSHGWNIVNDVTKYSNSRGLYAQNASSDVSVAIIAHGSGSQVVLTYLAK